MHGNVTAKDVLTFSVRWALNRPGVDVVLWGARKPEQLSPIPRILGWKTGPEDAFRIDRILEASVPDPVGPEFMDSPESVSTTD
jgi:aryl-alcohol dehydrogenase-like predicted oxidoreductase